MIKEEEPLTRGDVIIAPPKMIDSRFTKSVIMLTHFRNGAAFGLCLNKPSNHSVQDLTPELDVHFWEDIPLYWGGPVNPQTIWMLHSNDWSIEDSIEINQHWSMTSHSSMFHSLADGDRPNQFILTFGFCAWTQGQLEAEVKGLPPFTADSSWLTWHQPDEHVLEVNSQELWRVSCEQSSRQAVQRWIV